MTKKRELEEDLKLTNTGKEFIDEALEQQPSDDCVSRKAVAEIINKQRFGIHQISMGIIKEKIESLPSVTPTHKVGKWIRKLIRNGKGGCIGAEMICSCCNKDNRHDEYMDFCPNCGAKMKGESNNG